MMDNNDKKLDPNLNSGLERILRHTFTFTFIYIFLVIVLMIRCLLLIRSQWLYGKYMQQECGRSVRERDTLRWRFREKSALLQSHMKESRILGFVSIAIGVILGTFTMIWVLNMEKPAWNIVTMTGILFAWTVTLFLIAMIGFRGTLVTEWIGGTAYQEDIQAIATILTKYRLSGSNMDGLGEKMFAETLIQSIAKYDDMPTKQEAEARFQNYMETDPRQIVGYLSLEATQPMYKYLLTYIRDRHYALINQTVDSTKTLQETLEIVKTDGRSPDNAKAVRAIQNLGILSMYDPGLAIQSYLRKLQPVLIVMMLLIFYLFFKALISSFHIQSVIGMLLLLIPGIAWLWIPKNISNLS